MRISTRDLSGLPDPPRLERVMQSLAMLDAILSPEWDYRYYSFNSAWGEGERMGSIRNGSGDELFALFSEAGCFIKGFDHEAALEGVSASEFYRQVPPAFEAGVIEPAFSPDDVTFCYWRAPGDTEWSRALLPAYAAARDGSEELLEALDGDPASYLRFARSYFEVELPLEAVAGFFEQRPLSEAVARLLNPSAEWEALKEEAEEIGYPISGGPLGAPPG